MVAPFLAPSDGSILELLPPDELPDIKLTLSCQNAPAVTPLSSSFLLNDMIGEARLASRSFFGCSTL
jgi:hypothetical protein